jgi:predicted Fe-Mo cluster-binding NifX family protein
MKIAIAANGNTLEALIPDTFEESAFLLIVETDDGSYEAFKNPQSKGSAGLAMIKEILKHDCEALISGTIEKQAFDKLMTAQVTRYLGANCKATDALRLMDENRLDFIRVPKGEVWMPHIHDNDASKCKGHEEYS